MRLSLRFGVALAVLVAASAPLVARVFTDEGDVISRATAGLWLLAAVLVPGSLAFATDGSLIGAGDYRFLGRAALAYLAAVIPIVAVVLASPSLGIVGIWDRPPRVDDPARHGQPPSRATRARRGRRALTARSRNLLASNPSSRAQ